MGTKNKLFDSIFGNKREPKKKARFKGLVWITFGFLGIFGLLDSLDLLPLIDLSQIDLTQVKVFLENYRTEIEMYSKPIFFVFLVIFCFRRARRYW